MDPTRCEGGCGRWVFHRKSGRGGQRRFCDACRYADKRPSEASGAVPARKKPRGSHHAAQVAAWQAKNPERLREYRRRWREKRKNLDMR